MGLAFDVQLDDVEEDGVDRDEQAEEQEVDEQGAYVRARVGINEEEGGEIAREKLHREA